MSLIRSFVCLIFAAAACQFPAFESHYESRLEARFNESQKQLTLFEEAAKASGHTLDNYILFFSQRQELEFVENAKVMRSVKERHTRLSSALERLQSSPYPQKFIAWIFTIDLELARDTWRSHTLSLVLTTPTIIFGISGALIGYIFCSLLAVMARRSLHRRSYKTSKH